MNLYEAIMRAADSVESHPDRFNFLSVRVPQKDCGTPGCALGWIGFHLGMGGGDVLDVAGKLGFPQRMHMGHPFYDRMYKLTGHPMNWREDASKCARGLRLYAEKYHGHEKHNFARELTERLASAPRIAEEA